MKQISLSGFRRYVSRCVPNTQIFDTDDPDQNPIAYLKILSEFLATTSSRIGSLRLSISIDFKSENATKKGSIR
jgi:hypothetical protein